MSVFKRLTIFQISLLSIIFSTFSVHGATDVTLKMFISGGATEAQYTRFLSEFRRHYPSYIGEINNILLSRRPYNTGRTPDYAQDISDAHRKKLSSFLGNLSEIHVPTEEITRMRNAFKKKKQKYNSKRITISEIAVRAAGPIKKGEKTDFHHIIPLELCGKKQIEYYSQTLGGNDPFNVIQLTVSEHARLTAFINELR